MLLSRKPGTSQTSLQALGLSVAAGASEPTECVRVSWGGAFVAELARLAALADRLPDGSSAGLPLASVRALLSSCLPGPLHVRSDLGLRGADGRPPFAQCDAPEDACRRAAATAVRAWAAGPLKAWAEWRGIDAAELSAVAGIARSPELVEVARRTVDLLSPDPEGFADARDAIHAALARRLAGTELFPGLGSVRALVRSQARDNTVTFLTFPRAAERGSWSMRARMTVETLPGRPAPLVRLDVSRVRWCPEVPTGMPWNQRNLTATVFGPDERRAVLFGVAVSRGKVQSPEDPAWAMSALRAGIDPGEGFEALVAAGPRDGAFVGIPYAAAYEPAPSVATGATELDWLDCLDAVVAATDGFLAPLAVAEVPSEKRVSRDNEDIPAVKAATVLEDVARTLGHNEIDDDAIADAWRVLHGEELPKGLAASPKAAEANRRFDELKDGNLKRVEAVFGRAVPDFVVLSARADEGAAIAELARVLFAGRIRVHNRLLPEGVHGPRADLPKSGRPARERYEARLQAWKPLADSLAEEFGSFRALVHAPRFRDDGVNKIAGRVALARWGDANVQYLDARGRKADEWLFRVQAAVLDLMFGHSGLVSPVADHVAEAFPDPATRPRTLVGISVVSQARTSAQAVSSFFLAVAIDVDTGRTQATVARPKDGTLDYAGPAPFHEVLKSVASWDGARLGNGDAAKADFQEFLDEIVRPACERGERPLVMVDGAHARTLWPSMSNKGFAGPHTLGGRPLDLRADWPGARLVRVQDTVEPKVLTRKERDWSVLDPETGAETSIVTQRAPTVTEAARLVRVDGPAPNYVSSGDLDGQQKIAKGLSVYRLPDQYRPVAASDLPPALAGMKVSSPATRDLSAEPYKLPGAIGILLVHALPGDDPDRVAGLVHGLRTGFGHSRSPARMPAPLFQAAKVAEYIPAFALDDEDAREADDVEAADPEAAEDAAPGDGVPAADARPAALPVPASDGDGPSPAVRNPLLFLSTPGRATPARATTAPMTHPSPQIPTTDVLPFMKPSRQSGADAPADIPAAVRAKAEGDALLERMLELYWVGPLPSFADAGWFRGIAAGHSSIRTRQALHGALAKAPAPMKRFLPELDPRSDTSFADFVLSLMCVGDGISFVRDALPRAATKNARRWIFNNFYDTAFHRAKAAMKGSAEAVISTMVKAPLPILRKLHLGGNADLVRSYILLESLFMVEMSRVHADAAAALAEEFGEEYAEVAAFAGRVARFQDNRAEAARVVVDYSDRVLASMSFEWVPAADMPDLAEVTALAAIPDLAVPSRIDANWVRDKIALSGAFRSHLHASREAFVKVMGEPAFWPDEKPTSEALIARVQRLIGVPQPLLGAVTHRAGESLFRSFYRKVETIVRTSEEAKDAGEPRLKFPADWEVDGYAPGILQYLVISGYRDYAADFAILRAIENPSQPLEDIAVAAGPEFAEIAQFVRARRRASVWFDANDGGAWMGVFEDYLERFRNGERSPLEAPPELMVPRRPEGGAARPGADREPDPDEAPEPVDPFVATDGRVDGGTDGEDAEMVREATMAVTGETETRDARPAAPGASEAARSLVAALVELSRNATATAEAVLAGDLDTLDGGVAAISSLVDIVLAGAAAIPRDVSNAELLGRAGALGGEATQIAETLGEDVRLPPAPPEGMIAPAAAATAAEILASGELVASGAQEAIREVAELMERTRTARLNEIGAINDRIAARVSDVQLGLAGVIEALVTASPHLVGRVPGVAPPESPAAAAPVPAPAAGDLVAVDRVVAPEAVPDASDARAASAVAEVPVAVATDPSPAVDAAANGPSTETAEAEDGGDGAVVAETAENVAHEVRETRTGTDADDASGTAAATGTQAVAAPTAGASDASDPDDEVVEVDLGALDDLAATAAPEPTADVPPEEPDADGEGFVDPEDMRIDAALDRFMEAGSYGLAHHLARAAEAEGRGAALSTTSEEAKLAAIAGHLNHTALQSRVDLVDEWVRAGYVLAEAAALDWDRERASSRLLAAMPLMVELGIFFPASGADEVLRQFTALPGELGERVADVFASVSRIRHTNVTFTRAMLANVANELDRFDAMTKARQVLLRKAEQFGIMKFDFQLGMKIRNEMNKGDGLMGRLRIQLGKGVDDERTAEMLRDLVSKVPDRLRIVQLLDDAEEKVNTKFKGIDGAARDRFVGFFNDFRDEASNYLELVAEVESAKQAERPKAREFAKEIARALGGMVAAVEAAAEDQGRLGVAAGHAAPRLRKVANILAGDASVALSPMADTYHAIHAEMALMQELDFGRSWLPSPYDPGRIVDLLCEIDPPLLPPPGPDRDAFFEAAVHERVARGSYVGARMLLDAANFFGIPEERRTELVGELETNLTTARQGLAEDCAIVRRAVERLIRFGSLRQGGGAEAAMRLLDRVDAIGAVQVPVSVPPEERTEAEDPAGIYDVSVALDALDDIRAETQSLYDEPRLRLLRRVEEMAAAGTDPVLVDRLRVLCQHDDLLTAEEYIEDAAKTGSIPESRNLNWRFAEFSQVVLPKLSQHKRDLAQEVTAALRDGENFETIRYQSLSEARRSQSEEIVSLWREIFRRFNDQTMPALFSTLLDRLGIRAEMEGVVERASGPRRMFVADFKATFDTDQESLLLPDFGSRTEGWYRMAVMQGLPSDSAVESLCSAGKLGVIAFVAETVSAEQRKAFYIRNLEGKRRIILVDSASLFYALGEPSLRALTLLELGQPYSFVAPYHDWGRDAVPEEMFVGRREDIGHIFDTEGSCVVYGGRRMGKTAILRHLRATRHDPDGGTLVAFVDAQEIGKGPTLTSRIWGEIVASLPEVFGKASAVTEPRRVRQEIKRWLDEDQRRRVLMLIDEADQFVVADASTNYVEFLALQQLMTDTRRRFKFVLSGLSDVTRLVQTGNPPLKQISANPRRIGSLTGRERKDAEDLVLRPFAAVGITLQRTDVWRILSHANYYPVLIQTYAERLLQSISERARQSQKPIRDVSTDLVSEVMDDHKVREEIKGIFQFTLGIDLRYRLIAYVVASLVFEAEAQGRIVEGFRVREIRDLALKYWDKGFQDKNRFSLFDDLLDEMEGLGIVRRVDSELWTLRSSAVVRLLGNRDEIEDAIAVFFELEAPVGFDPKSHRRELPATKGWNTERKSSPLTLGQERDILLSKARATLVLGNRLADYGIVPVAIESAPGSFSDGATYDIRVIRPATAADLEGSVRDLRAPTGRKLVAIVPAASPWTSDWVRETIMSKPVAAGRIRVVFVGGPEHAASVLGDGQLSALTAHVATVPLEPWSTAYFRDRVNSTNSVFLSQRFDDVLAANGGWNDAMWKLLKSAKSARLTPETPDHEAVGLVGRFGKALRMLVAVNGDEPLSASDVDVYGTMDEGLGTVGVTGEAMIEYGRIMGLLVPAPGRPQGDERRNRFALSPLAARALGLRTAAAAE